MNTTILMPAMPVNRLSRYFRSAFGTGLVTTAVVTSLLLVSLSPQTANAAFVFYTDRTAFLNAATGAGHATTNEDFSTDPGDPFTITGAGGSVALSINDGSYDATNEDLRDSIVVQLQSTSVTGSVTGIGFDYTLDGDNGAVIFGVNGETPFIGDEGMFLGILSTDGMTISSVDVIDVSNLDSGVRIIDNVAITTIPVPATVWLFASALGLLGWTRRRTVPALIST